MNASEPVVVDLVEEGRAISGVLAILGALPGPSMQRVLEAVCLLIPRHATAVTWAEERAGRLQETVETFGEGDDDDDVP